MTVDKFMDYLVVFGVAIQASVVLLSVIAYGYCVYKRAWFWFMMASIVVFVRRLTGFYASAYDVDLSVLQALETIAISIMWLLFILFSTKMFRAHKFINGKV